MTYHDKLYELHLEFLTKFKEYSDAAIAMTKQVSSGAGSIKDLDTKRISLYDEFHKAFSHHKKLQMYLLENSINENSEYKDPFEHAA